MKRAALYVRQSTEHQEDSLRVQREEGGRYAESVGAVILSDHVYADDAISRAEYVKRPGMLAMLNAAERRPRPFDVIVLRDVDRLGGDSARNAVILSDLIDHGVEVHEYMTRNVVRMTSATDRMVSMLKNFAADIEREKTSARTRENHANKARRGLVTGGKVYGYRNVRRADGVHHEIDRAQAEVVREIFRRYAAGDGLRKIAHDLNDRGVPAPRSFWSQSSIQPMLRRQRYVGRIVWGERHKTYKVGTKVRVEQEPDVSVEQPQLCIVDQRVWVAVQERVARRAKLAVGKGRGPRPVRIPTLLAGFLQCGVCGGIVGVEKKVWGTPKPGEPRKSVQVYYCQTHRRAGQKACSNSVRRPVSVVDGLMAKWVRANIFTNGFIEVCVEDIRRRAKEKRREANRNAPAWEADSKKLRKEISKLSAALLSAKSAPDAVVQMISDREARLRVIEQRTAEAAAAPEALDVELARLTEVALARVQTMRESWPWEHDTGRHVMETILDGKLTVMPTTDGRLRLSGRLSIAQCEPLHVEEGRLVHAAKNRGWHESVAAVAAEDRITLQDHCVIPGRPRRDSNPC